MKFVDRVKALFVNPEKKAYDFMKRILTNTQYQIYQSVYGGSDLWRRVWTASLCIDYMSNSVASLPVSLVNRKDEKIALKDSKVANLLLNNPNQFESGNELLVRGVSNYMVCGNAYYRVHGLYDAKGVIRKPAAIESLFPNTICPELGYGEFGEPKIIYNQAVVYDEPTVGGNDIVIPTEEMIHVKTYNPDSKLTGIGWTERGESELRNAGLIDSFNNRVLEKGTFPTMNLNTDLDLTIDQQDDIIESYRKFHTGAGNVDMLLTWMGIKATPLSFSPKDMEIIVSKNMTGANICSLFKTPPELVGSLVDKKNTATYREARRQYYEQGVIPTGNAHWDKINQFFWPTGDFRFVINTALIPALRINADELNKKTHWTINELRAADGKPPYFDENIGGQIFLEANRVPIEETVMVDDGSEM